MEEKEYSMFNVYIMRGVPGSGKSTRAKKILKEYHDKGLSAKIFSTDSFFMIQTTNINSTLVNLIYIISWIMNIFVKQSIIKLIVL